MTGYSPAGEEAWTDALYARSWWNAPPPDCCEDECGEQPCIAEREEDAA